MATTTSQPATSELREAVCAVPKLELHQHVSGSIPVEVTWGLMTEHGLNPVPTLEEMRRLLVLQEEEEGTLLSYLDKFHYPHWVTQFYDNISEVTYQIAAAAHALGVRVLELRSAPVMHSFAGLTTRQVIVAILEGLNRAETELDMRAGLIVIAMRQQGPHIAKILARQAIAEAQHLHEKTGVVGFDIAGAERGNAPGLFRDAYEIARKGRLGLTAHAGEDEGPEMIWQALDELGVTRVGHGCSAVSDPELLRRMARDGILVECCLTSNYQTGAARRSEEHPIHRFLEAGVPVALCTDNTTVSNTDQLRESLQLIESGRCSVTEIADIHRRASQHSFVTGAAGRVTS